MKKNVHFFIGILIFGIGLLTGYIFSENNNKKQISLVERTEAYETQFAYLISEQLTALPTRTPLPSSTPTSTNTPIPLTPTPEPTIQGGGSGHLLISYYEADAMNQIVSDVEGNILLERKSPDSNMFFSPDGNKYVYETENGIEVSSLDGIKIEFQSDYMNSKNGLFSFTWFPDNQKILIFFSPGSTVLPPNFNWHYRYYDAYILNLNDQSWTFITNNVTFFSYSESNISPDGKWITLLKSDQMTYIASTDGTSIRPVIASKNTDIPFISPDSKSLIFLKSLQDIEGNTAILQFDISTLESTELLVGNYYSSRPFVSTQTMKLYLNNVIIDLSTTPPNFTELQKTEKFPEGSIVFVSPDENWASIIYIEPGTEKWHYGLCNLLTMEIEMINYSIPDMLYPWSLDSKQILVFDDSGTPFYYDVSNKHIIGEVQHPITDAWLYISWLP